ncbi:hypothetical protein cyc_03696 [Cyclospora cayetanensis]|uniref:Uncharacterized protein n=1 Tax=Cyclospora cayetanensis TaxID=88456 RepID=A0A1D3CSX6_9EIME|nr:hypothetical protein cyc_03696 [Cyclospora cayetanensis]
MRPVRRSLWSFVPLATLMLSLFPEASAGGSSNFLHPRGGNSGTPENSATPSVPYVGASQMDLNTAATSSADSGITHDAEKAKEGELEDVEQVLTEEAGTSRTSSHETKADFTATALAKKKMTPEQYAEAEKEVLEELQSLLRISPTTTTTKPPGIFKEVLDGIKNSALAPLRATRDIFTKPKETLRTNSGSADLMFSKLGSAISGEKGGWGAALRDFWRLLTMNPGRQKEAIERKKQSAINGEQAARNIMHSDGLPAEIFGEALRQQWELEKSRKALQEEQKVEEELQRKFDALLERASKNDV